MMKHASEPWQAFQPEDAAGWFIISDEQANEIGSSDGGFEEADARRIVACVNALTNVPTDWLESYTAGHVANVIQDNAQLRRQRDELLAICQNVVERGVGASDIRAMKEAISKAEAK